MANIGNLDLVPADRRVSGSWRKPDGHPQGAAHYLSRGVTAVLWLDQGTVQHGLWRGQSALDIMLGGELTDLMRVRRRYLDAERGSW